MRTLVKKEVQLLLPNFVGALALALIPAWLWPTGDLDKNPGMYPSFLFYAGILILALAPFGREIGLRTLPFIMAQPVPRIRLWRAKITVLAIALATVFGAWMLSNKIRAIATPGFLVPWEAMVVVGTCSVVLASGALWLTLWLRQTIAAFWLAALIPIVLGSIIAWAGAYGWMFTAFFTLYSLSSFFLARREFLHVQDMAWTGGTLTFSSSPQNGPVNTGRQHRPWRALFWKELQLQQVTLAGMTGLFLIHVFVVLLRKLGAHVLGGMVMSALEMFGAVWLFVPFLAGGQSIADERQIGTMDSLLALPFSRRLQLFIKFLIVLLIGGILSGTLLFLAEKFGLMIGAGVNVSTMGVHFNGQRLIEIWMRFAVLAWIGFYASTVARGLLSAMAIGIIATLALWQIGGLSYYMPLRSWGARLWPTFLCFPLFAASVFLAFKNCRFLFEAGRCWRRNGLVLGVVLSIGLLSSFATYDRVWELIHPTDAPHGAAVLHPPKPIALGTFDLGAPIVLPDGRLWLGFPSEEYDVRNVGLPFLRFINLPQVAVEMKARLDGNFYLGTNWVDAIYRGYLLAIKTDGTLWTLERSQPDWNKITPHSDPLVQFEPDANWQTALCNNMGKVALLKKDGTLWSISTNSSQFLAHSSIRTLHPQQVGSATDWDRIQRGAVSIYAWKRDGTAWALEFPDYQVRFQQKGNSDLTLLPVPILNNIRFKSMNRTFYSSYDTAVRDDGTVWRWRFAWSTAQSTTTNFAKSLARAHETGLVQIGNDSDWAIVAGGYHRLAGLKADGSLWLWSWDVPMNSDKVVFPKTPVRLGTHNDWIGLGSYKEETIALSADGTFWRWQTSQIPVPWGDEGSLLCPSRWPTKLGNIFSR